MSANGIGAVALIQPGVEAWSTKRGYAGADSIDDEKPGQPVGGLVLRVTEQLNKETGELERAFLCADHTRTRPYLHTCLLVESEIDRDTVQAADLADIRRVWRRAAEYLAFSRRYHDRTGPAVAEEARLTLVIYDAISLVFGADGILHAALNPPTPGDVITIDRPTAPPNVSALVD